MGNIPEMDVFNDGSVQKQTFSYNNDNQIKDDKLKKDFDYDNSDNLILAKVKGVTYQYSYDKANRLTQVKYATGNEIASYTYDSQGQCLTKTVGNDTITYHYFNGNVLFETKSGDLDNILHALYIRSPQGKPLAVSMNYNLSTPDSNTWYYYHYNAHGDVVAVTDKDGNVFREYVYDPYGNIISVKDGSGKPITDLKSDTFNHAYTYAGYRFDKETGLYYLNARYYEAGIGRFLTKDSLVVGNQYSYVYGDPVNFTDPSGNIPILAAFMIAGGFAGAAAYTVDAIQNHSFTWTGLATAFFKEGSLSAIGVGVGKVAGKAIGKISSVAASKAVAKRAAKSISSNEIRFSQSSVNGAKEIIQSMKQNGWKGNPIDVVSMPDGKLTTIDNTRLLAARYTGIDVKANIHNYNDLLPNNLIGRFTTKKGIPNTWGDAITLRIGKQNGLYRNIYPNGSGIIGWDGR